MNEKLMRILQNSKVRGKCECPNCHQPFPYDLKWDIDQAHDQIIELFREDRELEALRKEYATQDNRATAYPIYITVQELVCIGIIAMVTPIYAKQKKRL